MATPAPSYRRHRQGTGQQLQPPQAAASLPDMPSTLRAGSGYPRTGGGGAIATGSGANACTADQFRGLCGPASVSSSIGTRGWYGYVVIQGVLGSGRQRHTDAYGRFHLYQSRPLRQS